MLAVRQFRFNLDGTPKMAQRKKIPIEVAKRIAEQYGYEQIVIYARQTGENGGEHMTTYGVNKLHCAIAAQMGKVLQKFMGWGVDVE